MGKFTDPAYFLLDHYLETINIQLDEDIKSKIESLWPVIFTDIDNAIFQDYRDVAWNFEYETVEGPYSKKQVDYSYQASYLMGANKGIIAIGDRIIQLFVKDYNYGFREIYVTPPRVNYKDGNFFKFDKHITLPYEYGSTLTEVVSGARYKFEIYMPLVEFDPEDINDKEVYFRKDSQFHDWLRKYANQHFINLWNEDFVIRNYVNTDKQFMYFGKIYHIKNDQYHIEFYGMKDFVERAVPEHQRTKNLVEFFNVQFDRVYQEAYNLLKNIWSMIDPYEVDEKFLGYLAKFYNINVDKQEIGILNQREFIRELVYYLKMKGSYGSFYAAWKVLTQGTKNTLKIYEKWIDRDLLATVPSSGTLSPSASDFNEVLYTEQYNEFQLDGSPNDWILTPYYKVQLDMNTEPLAYDKVLPSTMINSLVYQWEELRPVNKVSEYEILFNLEVDLSGNPKALYPGNQDRYNTNVLSNVPRFNVATEGAYIQVFGGGFSSFLVTHNLNTNHLFIRCYDMDFMEIVPSEINFIDGDNIRVTFAEAINGFMLIKKPDVTVLQLTSLDSIWIIKHPFLQKEVYIEFNKDDEKIYSDDLVLIDTEYVTTNLDSGAINISKPNFVHMQSVDDTAWMINHNLSFKGVLISCFDINNNEIVPKDIEFVDVNNCIVTFATGTSGYAVLSSVGNPLFADMLLEGGLLPYYETNSEVNNFQTSDYTGRVTSAYETDDALFLIIELPMNMEFTIRELKIYDSSNNILIYTECGEIYKPMNVKMKIEYKVNKYTTKGNL